MSKHWKDFKKPCSEIYTKEQVLNVGIVILLSLKKFPSTHLIKSVCCYCHFNTLNHTIRLSKNLVKTSFILLKHLKQVYKQVSEGINVGSGCFMKL